MPQVRALHPLPPNFVAAHEGYASTPSVAPKTALGDPKNCLSGRRTSDGGARRERRNALSGALAHWLSTCLSSRPKRVRFPHASPRLFTAPLAQSGRRAALKPWMFRVRLSGGAPLPYCPRGVIGSRGELKPRFLCTFESCRGHHSMPAVRMAQSGRRARSRVSMLQVRVLLRTPCPPSRIW